MEAAGQWDEGSKERGVTSDCVCAMAKISKKRFAIGNIRSEPSTASEDMMPA